MCMGIVLQKGIFALQGVIEDAIIDLAEYLDVPANDGEKFRVIYERLLNACPRLHTVDELNELADIFIKDFMNEFGHHKLRVWYTVNHALTFADENYVDKYSNVLKICDDYVYDWCRKHGITLCVDAFLFGNAVTGAYKNNHIGFNSASYMGDGFNLEYMMQLWGLCKTIREYQYDEELMETLKPFIKNILTWIRNDYYCNLPYDEKMIKELYYELSEELHTRDGFRRDLFNHYDGYGNVVFNLTGEIEEEW